MLRSGAGSGGSRDEDGEFLELCAWCGGPSPATVPQRSVAKVLPPASSLLRAGAVRRLPGSPRICARVIPESLPGCFRNQRPGHSGIRSLGTNIVPGDIVEEIGGRPALEVLTAAEALQGAATAARRRFSALRELLSGGRGETVTLRVQSSRSPAVDVRLQRTALLGTVPLEPRPAAIADVAPGILYVDLTRIQDVDIAGALPRMVAAQGVVFDVRGYPRPTQEFLGHLSDQPLVGGSGCIPIVRLPDRAEITFECTESRITPAAPRVRGPFVFLTDARAMSYGETIMATVEAGHLGGIVGSETAGTNGNVHAFSLPGGYQIKWTPMKVTKPGGAQLHGIGVRPTVRTARTVDDVVSQKDRDLAKALEVLGIQRSRQVPASGSGRK